MKLEITLMSDLCAGAGKHYSDIIDLDTSLDEYGLPYIPAKRLKGCLKEAAFMIYNQDKIDEIFGTTGNDKSAPLSISDAKLEDYEAYVNDITINKIDDNDVADLFCSVRNATVINEETKIAKDKSLRFVRVVNQYSPIDNRPIKFISEIDVDKEFEDDLIRIAKALRNIGYHRNRGLGAVKCKVIDENKGVSDFKDISFDDDCSYVLDYTIKNDGDIMLPNHSADCTMDYIPGTSVLGAFAGLYCKYKYDINRFNDFFYSKDVKFSNLYITDKKHEKCYPAIRFMAKRKDISGIFNSINDEDVVTKPLKKGYLNKDNSYIEPISKRVYHNAVNSSDSSLYMQYCLCSGQYFSGTITAKGSKMKVLYELLKKDQLRFGKSKTAQYSNCSVIADSVKVQKLSDNNETVMLKKGTIAAYVLRSDVVIVNKNGIEQTSVSALKKALNLEETNIHPKSGITLTTISGYNAKWNLNKPHINAYKAGSALLFEVTEDTEMKKTLLIGEKPNEGFGVIELIENADDLKEKVFIKGNSIAAYVFRTNTIVTDDNDIVQKDVEFVKHLLPIDITLNDKTNVKIVEFLDSKKNVVKAFKNGSCLTFNVENDMILDRFIEIGKSIAKGPGIIELVPNIVKKEKNTFASNEKHEQYPIFNAIIDKHTHEDIKKYALEKISIVKLNQTQIGRLTLMCKEAKDMDDLLKRINSIKTKSTQDNSIEIYKTVKNEYRDVHWREYLITLLTLAKYQKKIEKKEDE